MQMPDCTCETNLAERPMDPPDLVLTLSETHTHTHTHTHYLYFQTLANTYTHTHTLTRSCARTDISADTGGSALCVRSCLVTRSRHRDFRHD